MKYGKQFNNKQRFKIDGESRSNNCFAYSINCADEIKVNSDTYISQNNSIEKSNDIKSINEQYDMYIYSYTLNFIQLKTEINKWVKEYDTYIKEYNDGSNYYITYIGLSKSKDCDKDPLFESYPLYTNKTFDNLFFEQKSDVLNRLQYFLNNKDRYAELGIPYTLGFLFYGIPGCGKTSCIKAIANYTNRSIVDISLSKTKTCGELRRIFLTELFDDYYISSDKKIIVLEDIDCMGDIVKKRTQNKELDMSINNIINTDTVVEEKSSPDNNIQSKLKHMLCESIKRYDDNDELTLSYLLNIIDGILEQPGRILIMTTNRPDYLDDALKRPGRIDLQIEFKRCSASIIKDIIQLYFKQIPDYDFPDYKYTQAEIFEKCFNINDYDKVCADIMQ